MVDLLICHPEGPLLCLADPQIEGPLLCSALVDPQTEGPLLCSADLQTISSFVVGLQAFAADHPGLCVAGPGAYLNCVLARGHLLNFVPAWGDVLVVRLNFVFWFLSLSLSQESLFCSSQALFSPFCQLTLFGSPAPSIRSPHFTWFLLHIYTSVLFIPR
ncbi:hypothetical protein CHARACLAT_018953 [Characodon lateralis]|uniref:Uncharacterized protein n=1 Tax=Characodon lateralis TaxID=208331 RepID=A0ABU7EBI4_9TELE|nr:hypothetical protein [Characodon lateralis]